jgi:hypothetical protein
MNYQFVRAPQRRRLKAPIRAELSGENRCVAAGITATGSPPSWRYAAN